MKKFGWGQALVILGLTWAVTAVPASAAYVLSIVGNGATFPDANGGQDGWGVLPGGTFQVNAVLTGTGPIDSAIFNVRFSEQNSLIYNSYLWEPVGWASGGADDFSVPEVDAVTGRFPADLKPLINNGTYPFTASINDVHFEAITRAGQTFTNGTLVTLTLKVPDTAVAGGGPITISPFADEFALFGEVVPTSNGSSLGVVIVPEPATLVLLGLGGFAALRRRFVAT